MFSNNEVSKAIENGLDRLIEDMTRLKMNELYDISALDEQQFLQFQDEMKSEVVASLQSILTSKYE